MATGEQLDCHPIGFLEQYQNGMEDHDVLAVPTYEIDLIPTVDVAEVKAALEAHMGEVFAHDPGRVLEVGDLRRAAEATALIEERLASLNCD